MIGVDTSILHDPQGRLPAGAPVGGHLWWRHHDGAGLPRHEDAYVPFNVTLDGCIDHREGRPDAEVHQLATEALEQADGLLLGRVTYELMEQSWRPPASDAFPDWMQPFARTIHEIPKYVASTTLAGVDSNAELLGGRPA